MKYCRELFDAVLEGMFRRIYDMVRDRLRGFSSLLGFFFRERENKNLNSSRQNENSESTTRTLRAKVLSPTVELAAHRLFYS